MKNPLDNLRQTKEYFDFLVAQNYRLYLGHSKIIGTIDGYNAYSLSTPPFLSKASANYLSRILNKAIQNRPLPDSMSLAITAHCNAKCEHCSFMGCYPQPPTTQLSLSEIKNVIAQAQSLGVSMINLVGGEPLLRQDLPEIISSINKDLSSTVLYTNGYFLEEAAADLKKSGLNGVYVSLDYPEAKRHDAFRKINGLFQKALAGLKAAQKAKLLTGLSICLGKKEFEQGHFDEMVKLSKELGVNEIIVFDFTPAGNYKNRLDLIGERDWIDSLIAKADEYNSKSGTPGILVYSRFASHLGLGCAGGVRYFYVSPFGDIFPCDFNHVSFGNIRKTELYKIWDKMSGNPEFRKSKWGGCRLKDPSFNGRNISRGACKECAE